METQPQLLLLQKTMVVAEGVGRALNPAVNMWQLAQPLIAAWVAENLGPQAQLRSAVEDGLEAAAGCTLVERAERTLDALPAAASGCIPSRWPRSPATVTAPPVACCPGVVPAAERAPARHPAPRGARRRLQPAPSLPHGGQPAAVRFRVEPSCRTRDRRSFHRVSSELTGGTPDSARRTILLIISGGIAAYKSLELIRRLREREVRVRCILTGGRRVRDPARGREPGRRAVFSDLFSLTDEAEMGHIRLSREADLLVVAPATADLIAKMAHGLPTISPRPRCSRPTSRS